MGGVIALKRVKVTSKGQITLPKSLRKQLNIKEGDYLDVSIHSNNLLLKPVPSQDGTKIIKELCKQYCSDRTTLEETRQILKKIPFSLSERTGILREK